MSKKINRICVFCGASKGINPIYTEAARDLAKVMLDANIGLVYGGASIGLMGEMADCMVAGGGEVIGVMPSLLMDREIAHPDITELHVVDSMSDRKNLLDELSDAFIMMPGGVGTLDEFFEVLTLAQLGVHNKPRGVLNVANYYDDLLKFLDHSVSEAFWNPMNQERMLIETSSSKLVQALINYNSPLINRWVDVREVTV